MLSGAIPCFELSGLRLRPKRPSLCRSTIMGPQWITAPSLLSPTRADPLVPTGCYLATACCLDLTVLELTQF